jgi:phage recombination protein Bet
MAVQQQIINSSAETEHNIVMALKESLYPDATDSEFMMIIAYCKAKKIDPVLKAVHLVPMSVKTDKKWPDGKTIYKKKKVIMPGIALYRIDAAKSGLYAGMDEPEFGEDITEKIGEITITYPKWCKVTVKKLIGNTIVNFTAIEYWKENYAAISDYDPTPNRTWTKRPYGQLAKCSEAQALRKGFPDIVGQDYTYEEMEGKVHLNEADPDTKVIKGQFNNLSPNIKSIEAVKVAEDISFDTARLIHEIQTAKNLDVLKTTFEEAKRKYNKSEIMNEIIAAKDKRKDELMQAEFIESPLFDEETGEIEP